MTATAPQTMTLSLAQIALDDEIWPRVEEGLAEERVGLFCELMREARDAAARSQSGWTDPLPPLVVVADASMLGQPVRYLLADGRHRYEARRTLGRGFEHVQVHVFQPDGQAPADRAYELALSFATISAKPLTSAEKRAAIDRLIVARHELSDRAIARLVGVSNSTVSEHRRKLCDSHTEAGGDKARRAESISKQTSGTTEPMRWDVAARRLTEDVADLLASCRKLFGGGPNLKVAGRELFDALADLYGYEGALQVIGELTAIVASADTYARKAIR